MNFENDERELAERLLPEGKPVDLCELPTVKQLREWLDGMDDGLIINTDCQGVFGVDLQMSENLRGDAA